MCTCIKTKCIHLNTLIEESPNRQFRYSQPHPKPVTKKRSDIYTREAKLYNSLMDFTRFFTLSILHLFKIVLCKYVQLYGIWFFPSGAA